MNSDQARKHVSVVIPTYNGRELLQKNLPFVFKAIRDNDEVVIVDDASSDDTVMWLSEKYQLKKVNTTADFTDWEATAKIDGKQIAVKLLHNHLNLRFGAAVNRGVAQCRHRLVLLLNNDVRPYPDVFSYLLPHFSDPDMFAVGCHEHEQHASGISGGKNKLWFERGRFVHSRSDNYETGETAWASGGSALFDKHKWEKLGGFDNAFYPAYWEDVDLSFRARQRGWKIWFEAKAEVDHNHESTNADVFGQPQMNVMSWQHAQMFTWKHASFWQKIQFLLWQPYYWWVKLRSF